MNAVKEEHAFLLTGHDRDEIGRLVVNAQNCSVLASVCMWKRLIAQLYRIFGQCRQSNSVTSRRVFKNGGETCLKSKGEFNRPYVVAENTLRIKTDVVELDITLHLQCNAIKKAAIQTDIDNDTATTG